MDIRKIIVIGALAALPFTLGCGKGEEGRADGGKPLTPKERKEKVEALKKEMVRLKAQLAELEGQMKAAEADLEKSRPSANE